MRLAVHHFIYGNSKELHVSDTLHFYQQNCFKSDEWYSMLKFKQIAFAVCSWLTNLQNSCVFDSLW